MQRVAIAADLLIGRKWARFRAAVGMMAGYRQVSDEKSFSARQRINPVQHAAHSGLVIDAEARLVIAANVAGVFQHLETTVVHDFFHSEIHEPARMEQHRAIALRDQSRSNRRSGELRAYLHFAVERW